jgi:regulator of cell morphogenesis and NO signaling
MNMILNPERKAVVANRVNYKSWPLDCLANYIEKLQCKTVTETANMIYQQTRLVRSLYATQHNIFLELEKQFSEMVKRLSIHMRKEEQHLFPFVREMILNKEINQAINRRALERIACLIDKLKEDHEVEKKSLQLSAELRENYLVVANVSRPVIKLLTALIEFAQACELHIKLQNTILFPTIIALKYDVV